MCRGNGGRTSEPDPATDRRINPITAKRIMDKRRTAALSKFKQKVASLVSLCIHARMLQCLDVLSSVSNASQGCRWFEAIFTCLPTALATGDSRKVASAGGFISQPPAATPTVMLVFHSLC